MQVSIITAGNRASRGSEEQDMNETETDAARNADGHAAAILEMYRACKALEDGAESAIVEGDRYNDTSDVVQRAEEAVLGVEVRGGWYCPGDPQADRKLAEYRILLTVGGPALRIRGELDEHGEAIAAEMEHAGWNTPWTAYRPELCDADEDDWDDALLWFVNCCWFGEGD